MEIQPSKSSRQKRCLMCHITEHVTLECQEVCSEEQKAMTEIEEMTLLDERKSYRVVVEGFCNNSNYWLSCKPAVVCHLKGECHEAVDHLFHVPQELALPARLEHPRVRF